MTLRPSGQCLAAVEKANGVLRWNSESAEDVKDCSPLSKEYLENTGLFCFSMIEIKKLLAKPSKKIILTQDILRV